MSADTVGIPLLQASVDRMDCSTDTEHRQEVFKQTTSFYIWNAFPGADGPTELQGAAGKRSTGTAAGGRPYVISYSKCPKQKTSMLSVLCGFKRSHFYT